jgi:hypothetical protein
MAHPNLHKGHAASLFKRGLISQKQHDAMMIKIAAMNQQAGSAAPLQGAAQPPSAPAIPATASVPGSPTVQGNLVDPEQPPAA